MVDVILPGSPNLLPGSLSLLPGPLSLLAQETPTQPLPEPVRQIAYMALLGIALLGMLMIVATLLGGHWVRRWGNRLRRPAVPPDLIIPKQREGLEPKLPDRDPSAGDTVGTDETMI